MLDSDLAELYEVETKVLNRAVKRNLRRFPPDFMFQLDSEEAARLRFQFGTSKARGGRRYRPYVFTEQGVAMLSSVLSSDRAVHVNVEIMRAFVRLRRMLTSNTELAHKLDLLLLSIPKFAIRNSTFPRLRCDSPAHDSTNIKAQADRLPPKSLEEITVC